MKPVPLDREQYRDLVSRALDEDIGPGDITTEATIAAGARGRGVFLANADCVVAGLDVAFEAFRQVAQRIDGGVTPSFVVRRHDGEWCRGGGELGRVEASARTLLMGERTALNFLQRLSGIATRARQFVEAARGRVIVLDTRKTTPTLRVLEKYAVRAGGASNHRFGLFDAILIKDNHIRLGGGVRAAVDRVRASHPALPVEVEVQSLAELDEALAARSDMILVDNMTTSDIRKAVERVRGLAKIEVSGGVTLERLPELAMTGADYVSVGALTHSAPAVDISFDIEPLG
jgi:nicotinate-nucleotide pyrophosphorylase (carboxylating)